MVVNGGGLIKTPHQTSNAALMTTLLLMEIPDTAVVELTLPTLLLIVSFHLATCLMYLAVKCCPSANVMRNGTVVRCCPTAADATTVWALVWNSSTVYACCNKTYTTWNSKTPYCCDQPDRMYSSESRCCLSSNVIVDAGTPHCCSSTPVGYVAGNYAWGLNASNILSSVCCPTNQTTTSPLGSKYCCPTAGNVYTLDNICCPSSSYTKDKSGAARCCAAGTNFTPQTSVWAFDSQNIQNSVCCANASATVNNGTYYCCNSTGYRYSAENVCCPSGNVRSL